MDLFEIEEGLSGVHRQGVIVGESIASRGNLGASISAMRYNNKILFSVGAPSGSVHSRDQGSSYFFSF